MEELVNFAIAFQAILLDGEIRHISWPEGDRAGKNFEGKLVRQYTTETGFKTIPWVPDPEEMMSDEWIFVHDPQMSPANVVCNPEMAEGALLEQDEHELRACYRMFRKGVLNMKPEEEAFIGTVRRYSLEYLRRVMRKFG